MTRHRTRTQPTARGVTAILMAMSCASAPERPEVLDTPDDVPAAEAPLLPTRQHRLTRVELAATLQDLLGEPVDLGDLPPEGNGAGYAGQAADQEVTQAHVEAWVALAEQVVNRILARDEDTLAVSLDVHPAPCVDVALPEDGGATWCVLYQNQTPEAAATFEVDQAGSYDVTLPALWWTGWENARGEGVDTDPFRPVVTLQVDGVAVVTTPVDGLYDGLESVQARVELAAGAHDVALRILWPSTDAAVAIKDLRLVPYGRAADRTTPRGRLLPCEPSADDALACIGQTLDQLGPKVWRRPLTSPERQTLLDAAALALAEGDSFDEALAVPLQALFLSPSFLYRVESLEGLAPGASRTATPYELAARLSYLVWRTAPDDVLTACAAQDAFETPGPCALDTQLDRLLASPRAQAFVDDFTTQWLNLGALDNLVRDPALLQGVPPTVGASFQAETLAVVQHVRAEELPFERLVDLPYTFVDADLAGLYGLDASVASGTLQRVDVPGSRAGLLGHGAFLAPTSHADETSVARRGRWVLLRLLCDAPPPPPATVPGLPTLEPGDPRTVPELLEAHRSDPACAACHGPMDAVGLTLEGFDPLARERATYPGGQPVLDEATTPEGDVLSGPEGLRDWMDDDQVRTCIASHLASWALARPIDPEQDAAWLAEGGDDAATFDGLLRHLVHAAAWSQVKAAP